MIVINEAGNRYGRLIVKSRAKNKHGEAHWICRCDCGAERVVSGCSLRRGHSKSCGCSYKLEYGEASFRKMIRQIKNDAISRNIDFNLSEGQVRTLSSLPCFYCGKTPSNVCMGTRHNGSYKYSGLDRVDNDIGYTTDNVVPCCIDCNKAKQAKSILGFLKWFKRIAIFNHWDCDVSTINFTKHIGGR